jgi:hypothetical protein
MNPLTAGLKKKAEIARHGQRRRSLPKHWKSRSGLSDHNRFVASDESLSASSDSL